MRSTIPLFALALAGCTAAAPPPPAIAPVATPTAPVRAPLPPELGTWIDAFTSSFGSLWGDAYRFNGLVVLARDGEVVFQKAYGKANVASGAVASLDTRFRVGSITKQFTATSILLLAEDHRLAIDASVRKALPELPAAYDAVTIHHLLTQTSGVPEYRTGAFAERSNTKMTPTELVAVFKDRSLDFEPGDRFAYSNSNYVLLGAVIERVSGKSYEEFLRARVLEPAGMKRTSTVDAAGAPDTASGYRIDEHDAIAPSTPLDLSTVFSAGALRSTARDLLAWDRAIERNRVLTPASTATLFRPELDDYACGFAIAKEGSHVIQWHNGGIEGFRSFFGRVPDSGLAVVVLSNHEDERVDKIAMASLRMAVRGAVIAPPAERAFLPIDDAAAKRFVGTYKLGTVLRLTVRATAGSKVAEDIGTLTVRRDGEALVMQLKGRDPVRLVRADDKTLFARANGFELVASEQAGGVAQKVEMVLMGQHIPYDRDEP